MRSDQITLPLYTSATVESPPLWRRALRLFWLLALAALYGVAMAYLPRQLVALPVVPIIVLLLLSLWLLPDRDSFPEQALFSCLNWFIILYYIWPSYLAIALPGLPWFGAGRIGLLVLMIVMLYSVSTSSAFRRTMMDTARASQVTWILLLVGLGAQTFSILLTPAPIAAVTRYLNNLAYWILPFFVGCFVFTRPGRLESFLRTLLIVVIVLCLFGFLEHQQHKLFWDGHIPSFLQVDNERVLDTVYSNQVRDKFSGTYRVHTTFTVSLIYAELLSFVLPFVLHWMITTPTLRVRVAMAAVWIMIVANIVYTDSRLGKIGFIVAHVGYALLWAIRSRQRRVSFATTAAVVAIPVAAVLALGVIFASHRLHAMVFGSEIYASSSDARVDQMNLGIPKILKNPLGYGPGNGGSVLGYHSPGGLLTIDSQYLKTTLEFGILGLLATYGLFLWSAYLGLRLYFTAADRTAELAGPTALLLIIYVIIKGVLAEDYNNTLGYFAVAIISALLIRARSSAGQNAPPAPMPSYGKMLPAAGLAR